MSKDAPIVLVLPLGNSSEQNRQLAERLAAALSGSEKHELQILSDLNEAPIDDQPLFNDVTGTLSISGHSAEGARRVLTGKTWAKGVVIETPGISEIKRETDTVET